ncbi:divalent-cation tolerance protein CutA [candidate division KSB1 bacterium]
MSETGKIMIMVTTASLKEASEIGKTLVEKQLAACCNLIPNIQSIYRWEDKVMEDAEILLMIKTLKSVEVEALHTIRKMHSYEVPEMITFSISSGDEKYFQWIDDSVSL